MRRSMQYWILRRRLGDFVVACRQEREAGRQGNRTNTGFDEALNSSACSGTICNSHIGQALVVVACISPKGEVRVNE